MTWKRSISSFSILCPNLESLKIRDMLLNSTYLEAMLKQSPLLKTLIFRNWYHKFN